MQAPQSWNVGLAKFSIPDVRYLWQAWVCKDTLDKYKNLYTHYTIFGGRYFQNSINLGLKSAVRGNEKIFQNLIGVWGVYFELSSIRATTTYFNDFYNP